MHDLSEHLRNGQSVSQQVALLPGPDRYADDLARAGQVADCASRTDVFALYHAEQTANTHVAQQQALAIFAAYLAQAGVRREAIDLYHDADAWRGMSKGLLLGFRAWLLNAGYAIGTINHRLAVVRQYCTLAHEVGTIPDDAYELLLTVKGYNGKTGRNLDAQRTKEGTATRKSTKKAMPTPVARTAAITLKHTTTQPARARRSQHDQQIERRDALLMGLLIEHALRVSEVASLNIEHLVLAEGTLTLYRQKTDETQTHKLKQHTLLAAEAYLAELATAGRTHGPLFVGYQGKRITRYGLYDRVRLLGAQLGIEHLSPHDLRHFWTYDALGNGTPIDRVQSGGGWKSPVMVLKYAKRAGIANDGVMITEQQD